MRGVRHGSGNPLPKNVKRPPYKPSPGRNWSLLEPGEPEETIPNDVRQQNWRARRDQLIEADKQPNRFNLLDVSKAEHLLAVARLLQKQDLDWLLGGHRAGPGRFTRQQKHLGYLSTGEAVMDRPNSHNHLDEDTLAEALQSMHGNDEFGVQTVDLGRHVGHSQIVPTEPGDEVYHEHRPGRRGPSRFVRGKHLADGCQPDGPLVVSTRR